MRRAELVARDDEREVSRAEIDGRGAVLGAEWGTMPVKWAEIGVRGARWGPWQDRRKVRAPFHYATHRRNVLEELTLGYLHSARTEGPKCRPSKTPNRRDRGNSAF